MPSDPFESGCSARIARPDSVSIAGAGGHGRSKSLHQRAPVRLLVVAHAHHVDLAIQAEERAGHRQAPSPTAPRRSRSKGAWCLPACCSRPAPRRCSACASRPGSRPRICSKCAPAYPAPFPGGARGRAARAATAHKSAALRRESRSPAPVLTSCMIRLMGNSGARSSGPSGLSVPGCSGGAIGLGKSAAMLYQARGMRFCGRLYWMVSMGNILAARCGESLRHFLMTEKWPPNPSAQSTVSVRGMAWATPLAVTVTMIE